MKTNNQQLNGFIEALKQRNRQAKERQHTAKVNADFNAWLGSQGVAVVTLPITSMEATA